MLKLGIIVVSIRDKRIGSEIADWVYNTYLDIKDSDVSIELIDLKEFNLPFHDTVHTEDEKKRVEAYKAKMTSIDGYILVQPEYNRLTPASLANAWAYVWKEVKDKALAFVGYGFLGASRSIFSFRAAASILEVAIVQKEINFSYNVDYENYGKDNAKFKPGPWHLDDFKIQYDQLTKWSKALKLVREGKIK